MTCIVGVRHKGHVYLGGDSAGVASDYSKATFVGPKVFRGHFQIADGKRLPYVLGYTCSFRMGQLLQYRLRPPPIAPGVDLLGYLVTDFVDACREAYTGGGWVANYDDKSDHTGEFLLGVPGVGSTPGAGANPGRLFKFNSDFGVEETPLDYAACGCGENYAMGSFHATRGQIPFTRLLRALEAAAQHSAGVAGPFRFVDTEGAL